MSSQVRFGLEKGKTLNSSISTVCCNLILKKNVSTSVHELNFIFKCVMQKDNNPKHTNGST